MLEDKEPLDVVFPQFLEWIRTTREEVSKRTGDQYYTGKTNSTIHLIFVHVISVPPTVLASHKAFSFGIPVLLAEIETRQELQTSDLVTETVFFSDTFQYLREVSPFSASV